MRKMGALRKLMPVTAVTFIIGWLAIAGVPPFAGFWSKDEILLYAFDKSPALYVVGLVTALLTAYYMTRQVMMVFFGTAHWKDHAEEHGAHGDIKPHESPWIMLLPLVVLSVLAIVGGGLQLPFNSDTKYLERWLDPVVEVGERHLKGSSVDVQYLLMAIAIVTALAGIALGVAVYNRHKLKKFEPAVLANAWYYDQTVSAFMGGPGEKAFEDVAWFDANVVDGAVNGTALAVRSSGGVLRRVQSGVVRMYAAFIGIGLVAVLAWFLLRGIL
jgi:NADH-quinone oxidoreductase subunit L